MPYDALYYPWIDLPSKVMLVNSLLYWDQLHTIVPETEDAPYRMHPYARRPPPAPFDPKQLITYANFQHWAESVAL